jgi:hypothetical protein
VENQGKTMAFPIRNGENQRIFPSEMDDLGLKFTKKDAEFFRPH